MRKPALLVGVVSMCLFVIMCTEESEREAERYYNPELKFSIEFPEGWEIREGDGVESSLVEAVSPLESDEDAFTEYIYIYVEDFYGIVELDTLLKAVRLEQTKAFAYFDEIEHGDLQIDSTAAKFLIYDIGLKEGYNRVISYTLLRNNRGYLISCLAEESKFADYVDQFERVAKSFRFEEDDTLDVERPW